ncbi:MAG: T9SS type A sorting domain-containing protein, partial [Bacteroidales bacterium]
GDASMYRFYINKAGSSVLLNGNIDVENSIYFRNGVIIVPQEFSFRLFRTFGTVGIFGDSDFNSSWIDGKFTRRMANGSSTSTSNYNNLFPIAKNGKKRFVGLDDVSSSGNQDWTVEYFDDNPLNASMDPETMSTTDTTPLERVSDLEYWMVDGPAGGSANVQLNWGAESGLPDDDPDLLESSTVVAIWDSGEWSNRGGDVTANGDGTGSVASTTASSFSTKYFTIATTDANNPLPVEFLFVDAYLENDFVILDWATATERNNDFFTVERSRDGVNFETVAVIPSKADFGYSNVVLNYSATDTSPLNGVSYYRIKQTDYDGEYDYSNIVSIHYQKQGDASLTLYPNPNRGNDFHLALNGFSNYENVVILINDLYGKTVHTEFVNADNNGMLNRNIRPYNKLTPGIYVVTVSSASAKFNARMVVQ